MSSREHARAMWFHVLASAFRTALACTIVGAATLHGPSWLRRQVAFPAFSYVAVILIITDASVGDTFRACWLALYATIQSVGPAILTLQLIGPARLTAPITALAAGLAGFVVVLPQSTHLIAKRISLGQIVITYVIAYIHGAETDAVMHPVHVAASTALGAFSCVLALLLPYPRLATKEVKKSCKLLAENTAQRLKLYVGAFCAEDKTSSLASISRAKILSASASTFHQTIKRYQPSMRWERLPFKFLRTKYCMNIEEKLQDSETALRGMEMALVGNSQFPVRVPGAEDIKNRVLHFEAHVGLTIKQAKNYLQQCDSLTVNPECDTDNVSKSLQPPQEFPIIHQDLSPFFFLFCLKLLQSCSIPKRSNHPIIKPAQKEVLNRGSSTLIKQGFNFSLDWPSVGSIRGMFRARKKRLIPALKLSISLGLAIYLGAAYSKENAYWSGLPVAVSLAAGREATFKVTNIKAQGTVLGTVYGVLGCFVFERFLPLRFMSLLPWFVFSSFLRRSRMYGQAGGISAVIGAVLILGRKNFGPPKEFAIARITETFIGLSCSIFSELLLRPTRASTLAKTQLSRSFHALHECVNSFCLDQDNNKTGFAESQKKLKAQVNELKKFMEEAEAEPNFWFLPFNSGCYGKLFASLSKMVDLLHFGSKATCHLRTEFSDFEEIIEGELGGDVKEFKQLVVSLAKCFEEITSIKSLETLERSNSAYDGDMEAGKPPYPNFLRVPRSSDQDEDTDRILRPYLEHSKEVIERMEEEGEEADVKSEMILALSALGYCMKSMMTEMRQIEWRIRELMQWENPSSNVDLHEISCKVRALRT